MQIAGRLNAGKDTSHPQNPCFAAAQALFAGCCGRGFMAAPPEPRNKKQHWTEPPASTEWQAGYKILMRHRVLGSGERP
jgi:hypothetical protein